jgi:uncharacterized membrane-anchored protein
MKRIICQISVLVLCVSSLQGFAAKKHKPKADSAIIAMDSLMAEEAKYETYADSVEKSITYRHGTIQLANGMGTVNVPDGFKYIDKIQAEHVLYDIWKNPREENGTLGLILPDSDGVLTETSYVFNIEYEDVGYVKDDDADKIDYTELLHNMQKETSDGNVERARQGFKPIDFVGWAVTPFYDKDRKILHWAEELKFGSDSVNTLNYNIRILGRKGVIILNAIASMRQLKLVQDNLPKVLDIVSFNDGNKYKDFNPSIDKVAAYTIGGLVAGKILAKVGFWALLIKFWKFIMIGIAGGFTAMRKKIGGWFKRKKNNDDDNMPSGVIRPSDMWKNS